MQHCPHHTGSRLVARDPEFFRHMTPSQMLAVLVADTATAQHTRARAIGAKCAQCCDTGMNGGVFCGCEAGAKIAYQSTKDQG